MKKFLSESLERRFKSALSIVRAAGDLALIAFNNMTQEQIAMKGPQDFLTETDLAVEKLLRERIAAEYAQDSILGEEGGGEVNGGTWILDPIDGTANFARGIPHFCIVIAFVYNNVTEFGVIYDPVHDELYSAKKNQGAWLNKQAIASATTSDFSAANLELGWSQRVSHERYMSAYEGMLLLGGNVRRSACGALGLAYVAAGRTDAYVELHMNPWDCLAGLLLVEEAGGVVNDFTGNHNWIEGAPVLASNAHFSVVIATTTDIELKGTT